MGKFYPYIILQ